MKTLTLGLAALLVASPVESTAQLAPANAAGLTFAHVHLSVADVELNKTLWSELLDGRVVERGGYVAVAVPGTLIFLTDRAPTGPSGGTAVNHIGFKVRDLSSTLSWWRSRGYEVDAEFTGGEGLPQAYITMPNGTRVELTGDPGLAWSAEMHHVHFHSPNHEALLAWWVNVLDGVPRRRGTIETTMDVPGANLSFAQADEVAPTQGTAVDHVGFEVEDIHAFAEALKAKGVEFEIEPFHVESLDIWVAFFVDPAGARIELSQGLDQFGSSGPVGGAPASAANTGSLPFAMRSWACRLASFIR
jgi:catechol 2,3-dioxygenase-like lactoylglutathione lyase family enzyme